MCPMTLACPQVQAHSAGTLNKDSHTRAGRGEGRGGLASKVAMTPHENHTARLALKEAVKLLALVPQVGPGPVWRQEGVQVQSRERRPAGWPGLRAAGGLVSALQSAVTLGSTLGSGLALGSPASGGGPGQLGVQPGSVPPRGPALPCGPEQGGGPAPAPALYVNQVLISPSGICVEYHFFNYRPRAGLAAACCGPITINPPVTINNVGAELHVFPML